MKLYIPPTGNLVNAQNEIKIIMNSLNMQQNDAKYWVGASYDGTAWQYFNGADNSFITSLICASSDADTDRALALDYDGIATGCLTKYPASNTRRSLCES